MTEDGTMPIFMLPDGSDTNGDPGYIRLVLGAIADTPASWWVMRRVDKADLAE